MTNRAIKNRGCCSYGGFPPSPDSQVHKVWVSSKPDAPLGMRESFYTNSYESVFSGVVVLLMVVCPSAVFRAISAISIYSVKRFFVWSLAHVFNKVCKGIFPPVANLYPSAAVKVKPRSVLVFTPLLHSRPNSVCPRLGHPVRSGPYFRGFSRKAPAGNRSAAIEMPSGNDLFYSAVTHAIPHNCVSGGVVCSRNNKKPAEFLPGYINRFSHFFTKFVSRKNGRQVDYSIHVSTGWTK